MRSYFFATVLLILGCSDWTARAAPYATDDADIVDTGSWQISVFTQGTTGTDGKSGAAAGLELEYGIVPGLQASVSLPVGFSAPNRVRTDLGLPGAEFGVKYGILNATQDGLPQISFCPSVEFALGWTSKKASDGATYFFLPLWAQESWGTWTMWGGVGLRTNPGKEARNSVFTGIGLMKDITNDLQLGAEIFMETSAAKGEPGNPGYNFGATYDLSDDLQLGMSAGTGLAGNSTANGVDYYLGLQWTI